MAKQVLEGRLELQRLGKCTDPGLPTSWYNTKKIKELN